MFAIEKRQVPRRTDTKGIYTAYGFYIIFLLTGVKPTSGGQIYTPFSSTSRPLGAEGRWG